MEVSKTGGHLWNEVQLPSITPDRVSDDKRMEPWVTDWPLEDVEVISKVSFSNSLVRQQAITWANIDPVLCLHMVSLGHDELDRNMARWVTSLGSYINWE